MLFVTIPAVGVIYGLLDVAWIRSEMARPDWDGQPDQDGIFAIGLMLRGSIACVLLFASFVVAITLSSVIQQRPNQTPTQNRG